ncbi:spermatogenesis-associated protein 33 [Varanus komodoensis]|uniref:spermatogenesis-associated protein 33 n=1 Tax=Varanus komodoensis TaxID=61221 RepID=UPI001CF7B55A|nr:spermatogenesis-associated protein 33 [Varanus komodoensis]
MGRSQSKHEDVAGGKARSFTAGRPRRLRGTAEHRLAGARAKSSWLGLFEVHIHRNLESSKTKDSKQAIQDQSLHTHSSIQPSTSKGAKKTPPHPMQAEVSADKLAKKKKLIPKIIVTGPSEEVLLSSLADELPDTRTIRDSEDYGPYTVHSKPSTIDAYKSGTEEEEK